MRFYHCFLTDLPDQFVEANAATLIAWVDGWADKNRYYQRARVIDLVPVSVTGDARKDPWPTLRATSAKMLETWLSTKGDQFHGRYWQTLAANQRGAADPTGSAGRDLADTLTFAMAGARNPRIALTTRARAGGSGLTNRQILDLAAQMLRSSNRFTGFSILNGMDERPPLQREGIVAGEITGYRCWRVEQGWLRSVYQYDIWPPGLILQGRELDDWNERGIHAWKAAASKEYFLSLRSYLDAEHTGLFAAPTLDSYQMRPAMVTGTVLLWGDVVEHERGWRAEFARVASLDWLYPDASMMGCEQQALDALRRRYGVKKEAR